MFEKEQWNGFEGRLWKEEINVRQFIQDNYTPYEGDESFLEGPTEATDKLWGALQKLQKEERAKGGVLDMDTKIVSSITSHNAGYIDESLKDLEKVVGLQTDKPLKRAFMPYGGIKMAVQACETYGYEVDPEIKKIFTVYHKTHNTAGLVLLGIILHEFHVQLENIDGHGSQHVQRRISTSEIVHLYHEPGIL